MSKRVDRPDDFESTPSIQVKKPKNKRTDHLPDCEDIDCEGCDIGEIEISFIHKGDGDENNENGKVQPTADELLIMAKEEYQLNKDSEIAKRLFDMALEAYEKEDNNQKTGFGYAKCLIELGRALNVSESLQEGYNVFVAIKKNKNNNDNKDNNNTTSMTTIQLWHTRAALALALSIRQQKQLVFEERRENLEDSDGEIDDALLFDLMNKDVLSRQEINLCKEVLGNLDEVMYIYIVFFCKS